jgi:hypothetical protein
VQHDGRTADIRRLSRGEEQARGSNVVRLPIMMIEPPALLIKTSIPPKVSAATRIK